MDFGGYTVKNFTKNIMRKDNRKDMIRSRREPGYGMKRLAA